MSSLPLYTVAASAIFLFCLLLVHEFRLLQRVKRAGDRLEHGKARGGYVHSHQGQRRLP